MRAAVPAGLILAALVGLRFVPLPASLRRYPGTTRILDRTGGVLRIVTDPDDPVSLPVDLAACGAWAPRAIVAAEDKRYFQHPGVDSVAVLRAVLQNVKSLRIASGASTLSTQVIRLVQPRERTFRTKLLEAAQALGMERRLNKRQILEQYMNRAPLGGNLQGIQIASRRYFGKDASDLSLSEAALLMGLPQSPSRLRPDRHLRAALARRNYVLGRMEALGFIGAAQRREAELQPVQVRADPNPFLAPHFCDLVLRQCPVPPASPGRTDAPDLRTTLDPRTQTIAETELARSIAELRPRGIRGGAVVVLHAPSGAVRALAGSPDYAEPAAGQVNCAVTPRSPGSVLKPFLYALAFDRGIATPATVVADVPMRFRDYEPRNFAPGFSGLVTLRDALVQSLNIPALALARQVGLDSLWDLLHRLGMDSLNRPASHYGLTLALGTAEVSLLEVANAYACLARLGVYRPWSLLEQTADGSGTRVLSPAAAFLVADVLSGPERAMASAGHVADAEASRWAWKTGTSTGFRDAWTVAWNPEYVVAVWMGNPDGSRSESLAGQDAAAPLAHRIARRLYPDGHGPWFVPPARIERRTVCSATGRIPTAFCPGVRADLSIVGLSDPAPCEAHANRPDPEPMLRQPIASAMAPGTHALHALSPQAWPATVAWELRELGMAPTPPAANSRQPSTARPQIVSPVSGRTYRPVPGPSSPEPTLFLRAQTDAPGERVFWFVNGVFFRAEEAGRPVPWPMVPGTHTVLCVNAAGCGDRVSVSVEPP